MEVTTKADQPTVSIRRRRQVVSVRMLCDRILKGEHTPNDTEVVIIATACQALERENALLKATIDAYLDDMGGRR